MPSLLATALSTMPATLFASLLVLISAVLPTRAHSEDPFLRRTHTVRVVEQVGPAVVNITMEKVVQQSSPFAGSPFESFFFRDFFEPRAPRTVQSLGSGVIFDAEGHILTNEHVIRHADTIRVALDDGREFEATLVGADPNNDLAVLKINTKEKLPWVSPGTSADLMVGEPVIAIGNPFGLSSTVTTGVISALDRSVRSQEGVYHGFLQTDASINPGNSGGPLMNAEGALIGINTAVYQEAQGIGFAIPIDLVARVVNELIQHGEITPVWLGIDLQDLQPDMRNLLEIPPSFQGALIRNIYPDSPAQAASLERGQIVTHFDGHVVENAHDFYKQLARSSANQQLKLKTWNEGKSGAVSLRTQQIPEPTISRWVEELLGMQIELREDGGYIITGVRRGSTIEDIGVRAGDYLLAVNGYPLNDKEGLRDAMINLRGSYRALLMIQRGDERYRLPIPLP